MMTDLQNVLSDAQAPTTGTTVSTNTIDLGVAGTPPPGFIARGTPKSDLGGGKKVFVDVRVVTTCTSGGSNTTQVQLITSASANLGSPTVIQSTAAIAVATLVAGYKFRLGPVPSFGNAQARYLGVQYVIATADLTAGAFDAELVVDSDSYTAS